MTNTTAEVVTTTAENLNQHYYVALKFQFYVSEYLYGSGADTITAYWVSYSGFNTNQEAETYLPTLVSQRNSQFDDRDAILFLEHRTDHDFIVLAQPQDHYLLADSGPIYSLISRYDRRWLPATTATPATPPNSQKFLLEAPVEGSAPSTITLGDLKAKIAPIAAEISTADNSEQYKQCLQFKYRNLREIEWTQQKRPEYTRYEPDWDGLVPSGSRQEPNCINSTATAKPSTALNRQPRSGSTAMTRPYSPSRKSTNTPPKTT